MVRKNLPLLFSAFLCGLLFAVGLCLAGMTNPANIIAFLNLRGSWSPSLLFVMGGALMVCLFSFPLIQKQKGPLLDTRFHPPLKTRIDWALLTGSALFGIGWGLSGYCPGPLITSLGTLRHEIPELLVFFVTGLLCAQMLSRHTQKKQAVRNEDKGDSKPS